MTELKIFLQDKQKEFARSIENFPVTFYGGAKGGGKSKGLQLIMLLRRFKYAGSTGAIFRKTYPELEANHIRTLFQSYPELREYYVDSKKLLTLPNGSTLQFCYARNEADLDLYQGREFHDLAIDEMGQWTEAMFRKLLGSNRSSKKGIAARAILTGNPGGPGHKFLKRVFIEKRYNERERAGDYNFIQALVDDNPALIHNDPDYVYRLESEPNEALRKAYRYGSWDIFAGQFFSEISSGVHVIRPFSIPRHWNRFGSYDYGFNHPAAFGWFAVDEDGNVYLYREMAKAQMRVDQFAQHLNQFEDTAQLSPIVAGWDCWTKKGTLQTGSTPTIAEEFLKHKIILSRAKIDRVQGASQVRNYLAWRDLADGRSQPRFYIFDTCPVSFDALTRMEHDPNHAEDVLKVDATEGDPMSGDDCFARGTLIATKNGQKPIEQIQSGDLVWTRQGLKPVVDSWLNGLNSPILKLYLSDEREIQATPNHKFWQDKGFVSVDTLRYGDRLLCLNPKVLCSTESNIGAIPNLPENISEITSGVLGITASEVWARCMSIFGNRIMEKFPMGTTFTTSMGIHSTTRWKIWCRSLLSIIAASISKNQLEWQKLASIFRILDPLLVTGIEATMVENGTVRMLYAPGLSEKGSKHLVYSVPEYFIHFVQKSINSVARLANKRTIEELNTIGLPKNAHTAKNHLRRSNMMEPSHAPVFVEAVLDSGRSDTYSIHVADCHEYYANGILVSNCYDMVRYGLMSRPMISDPPKVKHQQGTAAWAKYQAQELEKSIDKQVEYQQAEERGEDIFHISGLDSEEDIMSYYINKRKQ